MLKLFLLLMSLSSYGYLDLSASISYRSFPSSGGEISLESGYNMLFYGSGKGDSLIYGLLRPKLRLASSGVINSYDMSIEFFPISFLGFEIGHSKTISNYEDFDFYNCEEISCSGAITRDYVGQKLAFGLNSFLLMAKTYIYRNQYTSRNSVNPIGEFRYFSLANNNEDQNYFSQYAIGLRFKNNLLMIVSEYNRFIRSDEVYKMNLITYINKIGDNIFTFGLGTSKSTHVKEGFSTILQWKYNFKDSQKLF